MARRSLVLALVALVACQNKEAPPEQTPPVAKRPVPPPPPDAPPIGTQFFAPDGAPSAEIAAFCRGSGDELRELSPGVSIARRLGSCQLWIEGSPVRAEVLPALRRWSEWDTGELLDQRDQLTVSFSVTADRLLVNWTPYVPLEQILGTNGKLLLGVDIPRILRAGPNEMSKAITRPYTITKEHCDANGCSAYGPNPPGGEAVAIFYFAGTTTPVSVKISTVPNLVPRIHELIAAALGPGVAQDNPLEHVHLKDGLSYLVRESDNHRVVNIWISKQ